MAKNTINIINEADLIELKSKLIRDENKVLVHGRTIGVIVNFALQYANEYYGIHEYGNKQEIERQLYEK